MKPIGEILWNNCSYFDNDDFDVSNIPMIESESKILHPGINIINILEALNNDPSIQALDEASYMERAKSETFKLEVLDVDKYIKANELKPITNPTFFGTSGSPTPDGLLSNEIFGITQKDRAGTFAYIDLGDWFIDPSCYKTLVRIDKKFSFIIKSLKKYSIDKDGNLVEDEENGGTGIRWLKANFDKLNFNRTKSHARDMRINYIVTNYKLNRIFINKYIVIPPYYRDVNTSGKYTGVGQINTLYVNLITAANSLRENKDYGLSMADSTCARIQDTLKNIYDWFCGNNNDSLDDPGTGMGGKFGMIKANLNYTSDYASRLVLSAPEYKVETIDDLMVTMDKSAIPLAAASADFYPFMIFHMRRFFENEFQNVTEYECINPKGELVHLPLNDPMLAFNDDYLKEMLKKFIYSHDNRFIPIQVPTEDTSVRYFMTFKGFQYANREEFESNPEPIVHRPLTWVDVIYQAAVKSADGKIVSITRFPYDSYFNTIYTGVEVASTKETEPLVVNGELYRFYPKIRMEDIYKPSAMKFVDTMQISNLYLDGMGADYDGDMISVKGAYFNETNEELRDFTNSKANFINLNCENIRTSGKEAIQALYNLTKVLSTDEDKLTNPEF